MRLINGSLLRSMLSLGAVPVPGGKIATGLTVTYLGHAAFRLVSPQGVTIYVDPFLSANPLTPEAFKLVEKADLILVTHGHGDHLGDSLAIAEKTGARIVAMPELARYLTRKGAKNVVGMNKGGTYVTCGLGITMVNAFHSSSVTEGDQVIYTGEAAGFVIKCENGFTVYHAGDTCIFDDMKIIGKLYRPQLALLPIGSHFTMDPEEAAGAAELVGSKYVIPMHWGTFPVLTGTVEAYERLMSKVPQTQVLALKPGDTYSFPCEI
jgi:L-ascorbate metabolism protein UlaG (beta-lactamase superfamily)